MFEEDKLTIPEESPHVRIIKELEEENAHLKSRIKMYQDGTKQLADYPYLDISHDGMRLDRNIKRAEKRLRAKELSTEDFIKLSNAMTYMISKKTPIADLVLGVSDIVKNFKKK